MLEGGGACVLESASSIDSPASEETTGRSEPGRPWTSRSRPRKLSDDISATRRRQESHTSRCLLTDSGRDVVELAQAIGLQDLVGRVDGGGGAHHAISSSGSNTDRRSITNSQRPQLRGTCRENPRKIRKQAGEVRSRFFNGIYVEQIIKRNETPLTRPSVSLTC